MDGKKEDEKALDSVSQSIFVTVGTTRFDDLIKTVTCPSFLKTLKNCGYNKILIQTGGGKRVQKDKILPCMEVESYDFKKSIYDDILNSALIISHAGAGSIIEVLKARKPLIVVINEKLMDNHQFELAEAFQNMNNLYYCTCSSLEAVIKEKDISKLVKYEEGTPEIFGSYIAEFMGLSNDKKVA